MCAYFMEGAITDIKMFLGLLFNAFKSENNRITFDINELTFNKILNNLTSYCLIFIFLFVLFILLL